MRSYPDTCALLTHKFRWVWRYVDSELDALYRLGTVFDFGNWEITTSAEQQKFMFLPSVITHTEAFFVRQTILAR